MRYGLCKDNIWQMYQMMGRAPETEGTLIPASQAFVMAAFMRLVVRSHSLRKSIAVTLQRCGCSCMLVQAPAGH
jgi:hypothetical protein